MQLIELLDSTVWRWISLLTTLYVLVNDQITLLVLPKSADLYIGLGTAAVFLFFIIEMVLTSIVKKGYFGRGFFVQDLTAVIALVPDVLLWVFGVQSINTLQNLVVSRAGRIARMGMRFGRMGRITDILALLGGAEEGRRADDATDPTFIGRILLDVTNRKVILGLIVLLFALPYFNVVEQDKTVEIGARELLVVSPALFQPLINSLQSTHPELMTLTLDGIKWIDRDISNLRIIEIVDLSISNRLSWQIDISEQVKWNAIVALISTGFVVLLLLLGAMMFSKDLNMLVIRPVEHLKTDMDKLSCSYDQLSSENKDNLLGQALDSMGAVIQVAVTLSNKINTGSRERLAMTLKEVANSIGANHVCLYCIDNDDQLEHVRSDTLSSVIDEEFRDLNDPPLFVLSICEASRALCKPLLINNWTDVLEIQKNNVDVACDEDRVALRKYSIMVTPLIVGDKVIGVLYVHKHTIFHKNVTKFFGDDRATKHQKSKQSVAPLRRRNSLRVFRKAEQPINMDMFVSKNLHLMQAAGNQVAIMISLIRAVSIDVEKKWKSTKETFEHSRARDKSFRRKLKQERQHALQLLVSGFDRNAIRSIAEIPRPRHVDSLIRTRATTLAGTAVWPRVSIVNDDSEMTDPRELFMLGRVMASKSSRSLMPLSTSLDGNDARILLNKCIGNAIETEMSFHQREDLLTLCGTSALSLRLLGGLLKNRQPGQQRWIDVLNLIKSTRTEGEAAVVAASVQDLDELTTECLTDIGSNISLTVSEANLIGWWSVNRQMTEVQSQAVLTELTEGRHLLVPCSHQNYHVQEPVRDHLRTIVPNDEWAEKESDWAMWLSETSIIDSDVDDVVVEIDDHTSIL